MTAHDRVLAVGLVVLFGWAGLALLMRKPNRPDVGLAGAGGTRRLLRLVLIPAAHEGHTMLRLTATTGLTAADLGVPRPFLTVGVLVRAARERLAVVAVPPRRAASR